MTTEDEVKGTKLLEKQFVSLTETLLNLGISKELLHSVVGAFAKKTQHFANNQGTLAIGRYLREVIHTYSDDLKGE